MVTWSPACLGVSAGVPCVVGRASWGTVVRLSRVSGLVEGQVGGVPARAPASQ